MSVHLSRRTLLASTIGIAGSGVVSPLLRPARAATTPFRLTGSTRTLDVNGRAARVFGLVGPNGMPGLTLNPGERFITSLINETQVPTIIHWHGQLPPWKQDGFPWPETPPIAAGAAHAYDFAPIPGTFWMHSHQRMQGQVLMTAPLIVRSAADLQEDRQEIVLLLHDFSFRSPKDILAGLTNPAGTQDKSSQGGMSMSASSMGSMAMGSATAPDLNDVDYDAFLANDRTLADPEVIRVGAPGRVRLRIINGASASQFWLDLGALRGTLVAVDGHDVEPVSVRRVPLSMAQRVDILLDVTKPGTFPILAQVEGKRDQTGIIMATSGAVVPRLATLADHEAPPVDLSLEKVLHATTPLAPRPVDVVHRMVLSGHMSPYAWSINGEYWPKITPLMVAPGQRVALDMVNQSSMAHPMHLHGHAFQVIALNGVPMTGAIRDTVMVPPKGSVRVVFDANNPGRWAVHCHNLYHMMTGMMTEIRYPGIV
jgi:FtsP/CotA-like multicopper oxidase with cupredoxin domain